MRECLSSFLLSPYFLVSTLWGMCGEESVTRWAFPDVSGSQGFCILMLTHTQPLAICWKFQLSSYQLVFHLASASGYQVSTSCFSLEVSVWRWVLWWVQDNLQFCRLMAFFCYKAGNDAVSRFLHPMWKTYECVAQYIITVQLRCSWYILGYTFDLKGPQFLLWFSFW